MTSQRRRPRVMRMLVTPLVLVFTGAACSDTKSCTLVGAVAGISVSGAAPGSTVKICLARGECGETQVQGNAATVALGSLQAGGFTDITVNYSLASGGPTVTRNLTVPVETFSPNGAGCAPSVARAAVVIGAGGAPGPA